MDSRICPKSLALLLLTALPLLFLQACHKSPSQKTSGNIPIGVFQSLSGPEASFGQDALSGIRLAEEQINSKGGVLGRHIQLIVQDNQSKPGETSSIVRELISRNNVVALIGEVASGRTLEAAPIAQRSKIPLVANSASNEKVTQAGDFIFRVSYRDSQQGEVLATYAYNSLGKRRAALLVDISKDNSTSIAKSFKDRFTALGGKIVKDQHYNAGDKNFAAQLTAIEGSNADCLLLPGYYTDSASIMKQARKLGLNMLIMGGDGWDSADLIRVAGHNAEGAIFTNTFAADDPHPAIQSFVKDYMKKYSTKPMAVAATGYDALMLVADAIRRAGGASPQAIRDALATTKDYQGVSGTITFDEHRDPSKTMVLLQVQNSQFQFIERRSP